MLGKMFPALPFLCKFFMRLLLLFNKSVGVHLCLEFIYCYFYAFKGPLDCVRILRLTAATAALLKFFSFLCKLYFCLFSIFSAFFNNKFTHIYRQTCAHMCVYVPMWLCAYVPMCECKWCFMLVCVCVCVNAPTHISSVSSDCLYAFGWSEKIEFLSIISKVLYKSIWLSSWVHQTLVRVTGVAELRSGVFGVVWIKICLQLVCSIYMILSLLVEGANVSVVPFLLFNNQI